MKNKLLALILGSSALACSSYAALITSGILATASEFNGGGAGFPPTRTIDGSGLSGGVHNTNAGTSWLTVQSGTVAEQWIQWDLGDSYTLDSIHVWNANQSTDFSTKGVDIYYSNVATPGDPEGAGVANWTQLGGASLTLPQADNTGGYTGFDLETATSTTLPATAIRFVRFELNSNWVDGNSYTGIAEIQFDGTVVPEPSSILLIGSLGAMFFLRRRR